MNRTCSQCGSTKYYCKGLCKNCYNKQLVPKRWSEKSDFCVKCGTSQTPHVAHGLCKRCFNTQKESGNLCACGCGLTTSIYRGVPRKFRKGHWLKVQNSDSEFQKAHKERFTGKNNPQYGKFGKDHPAYGHETSQETRELRRQVAIKRVASQKKSKTDIEIILSNILDELEIEHVSQKPIKGKFVVDEFLPKYNAIIEANGDYWHGNPSKFPNPNKLQSRNMSKDNGKFIYLHRCGYIVMYLWENELKKHKEFCRRRILDFLKNSASPFIQDSVD